MANTQKAFGMRPISIEGTASNTTGFSNYTMYEIANGNTNAIYQGMPVIPLATGYIDRCGAAAGGSVSQLGVFWGCQYVDSTTGKPTWKNYWPGSGADSNHPIRAQVYDNPSQVFLICSDASLTTKATLRGHVFSNAPFSSESNYGAQDGSTTTGLSAAQLGVAGINTTNTLAMRILGWNEDPDNQDFTASGIGVMVRFNNHFNAGASSVNAGTTISTTGL